MKKIILFSITAFVFITPHCAAQINYPFRHSDGNGDILAYWYNVPQDSVKMEILNQSFYFHSSLQIYGKAPGDSFQVQAKVYLTSGEKVFDSNFEIEKGQSGKSYSTEFNGDFFKLDCPVDYLEQNPDRIIVTIQSSNGELTKEIKCRYHRLFGIVSDFNGKPFEGLISIGPETFMSDICIKCDSSGNYEIELPERTYNTVICFGESYGIKTLEVWAWHIIMDSDQRLDFKVGTGEVYNLIAWANNGGPNTYFISFRPMILPLTEAKNINELLENIPKYPVTLNNNEFLVEGLSFDLEPEDIKVWINGKEVRIISVQKYFETGQDKAQVAYVVQVNRKGLSRIGKQTVMVEFKKDVEKDGIKAHRNSMGYFQFYLNYTGLSNYF